MIRLKGGKIIRLREPMPELEGATAWINGEKTKAELVGEKMTLIHFWSVSCGICKEAIPKINQFRDDFKNSLNVIAVHLPRSDKDYNLDLVRSNVRQYKMTQPVYVDSDAKLTSALGSDYVPAYYIFDKEGKLRHFQAGKGSMVMLERRISRLLNELNR